MTWQEFFMWVFRGVGILCVIAAIVVPFYFGTSVLVSRKKNLFMYLFLFLMALSFAISASISQPDLFPGILVFTVCLTLPIFAFAYFLSEHVFGMTVRERRNLRKTIHSLFRKDEQIK